MHRLDVEAVLGHDHAITDMEAVDAATYPAQLVMPMLRTAAGEDPGAVTVELRVPTASGKAR